MFQREERLETQKQAAGDGQEKLLLPGAKLYPVDARLDEYPAVNVAVVIMRICRGVLQVFLTRRRDEPYEGMWALPADGVLMQESLEEAARRIFQEKIGRQDGYIEQLYTFGDTECNASPRTITIAYVALLNSAQVQETRTQETAVLKWSAVSTLPSLAFDHEKIVQYAISRLRSKITYTPIAFSLLSEQFTLRELQHVYECILHRQLDKRNFRKKIGAMGILEETGATKMEGMHRPARLYRLRSLVQDREEATLFLPSSS
jgi:8-oxo-dGTP diphosphatase